MPLRYSRGSWCDLRVPEKMMFGRTSNVGFDTFSRYPGSHALAAGRLVVAARRPWPACCGHSSQAVGCGRPLLAMAGHGWLQPAAVGQGLAAAGYGWLRPAAGRCCAFACMGIVVASVVCMKSFILALCGPSIAVLTGRLIVCSAVGYYGSLDRCATLVHEMFWTCDCREAPRPSAADSRRQCPLSCAGLVLVPMTSACMVLPVPWEVAFSTCWIRCVHLYGVTHRL